MGARRNLSTLRDGWLRFLKAVIDVGEGGAAGPLRGANLRLGGSAILIYSAGSLRINF